MPDYLLDTNMLIAAIRGREPVRARLESVPAASIMISPVVLGELLTGVEKSERKGSNRKRLLTLLEDLRVLRLEPDVARYYGRVRALLEKRGTPIGANDTWIAAHSLSLGAVLVTDNEKEFRQVPALQIENWLRD